MNTTFLVFTDLHVDIMHDAAARMEVILDAAEKHNVDFLLHLGDIMYPEESFVRACDPDGYERRREGWFICDRDDEKQSIRKMIAASGRPLYGVLGNHDMDACDKAAACRYWHMPAPHYTFCEGGVRFIALDSQFILTENGYEDFAYNNYKHHPAQKLHRIPPEQLRWLEETIFSSSEPCVLLKAGTIFGARHIPGENDDGTMVSCVTVPRFSYEFYRIVPKGEMIADYPDTKAFFEKIPGNPFDYQFLPAPGAHTWEFWDEHIQDFIKYLNLPDVSAEYK